MKIFVISLVEAQERRNSISSQMRKFNLEFTFFDAIHGKEYYDNPEYFNKTKSLKHENRVMNVGEIGCALSHLEVYKQIINDNLPYALILEDDTAIAEDFPQVLPLIEKEVKPFDLITLVKCDIYKKTKQISLINDYKIVKPRMVKYGSMSQAAGYIITREAAQAILSFNFPVIVPADSWEWYRKTINFRGIIPSKKLIHQNMNFESSIITGVRKTNDKSTVFSLLFYAFYTRTTFGRLLKNIYKIFFKREK